MSTQTLAEASKLIQDDLVGGVAELIVTTNPMWGSIPWIGYKGDAVVVNGEAVLGDSQHLAVGGTITAKAPAQYQQKTFTATKTIGDAEVDGLVSAQTQSDGVDLMQIEVSSKAKSVGRKLQTGIAVGSGVSPELNSFHTLCAPSQYTAASDGQAFTLELLDELMDLVKSKDGEVDFLMAPAALLREFKKVYRAQGGAQPETTIFTLPNGTTRNVLVYEGVPFFQNDYLSVNETANGASLTGGNLTSVYAGNFDEGDRKSGFAMIYPDGTPMGIQVETVGVAETKDEKITRIKSYCNAALFNELGLARATSIDLSL